MSCPDCGKPETRERCCWPMPASPLSFFGPETWLDDDEIDRSVVAGRLSASEFTTTELADLVGLCVTTVKRMSIDGRVFASRYEEMGGGRAGVRAVYGAEKVAGLLMARGMAVSA